MLACLLGSLLGFLPIAGSGLAPGILIVFLLLILHANIFLAGLVAAGTKLLSIALAPPRLLDRSRTHRRPDRTHHAGARQRTGDRLDGA